MTKLPLLLLALLAPTQALAQTVQPAPISEKEQRNYCVWNNAIYSYGARFCIGPGEILVCRKAKDDVHRGFLIWSTEPLATCKDRAPTETAPTGQ